MKTWKRYCAGLAALAGLTPALWAQPAALPTAPPALPGPAVAAPAPPGGGLWAFLCPNPAQIQECKDKICKSPLGKLLSNGLKPVSVFTGGMLGNCCPSDVPSPADLAKGGAEGLAA